VPSEWRDDDPREVGEPVDWAPWVMVPVCIVVGIVLGVVIW
jgi:hypothetical protein